MIFSKETLSFLEKFRITYNGIGSTAMLPDGKMMFGVRFPCYWHGEVSRDTYFDDEDWTPECHVVLNDKYALHLDEHDEATLQEDAGYFRYRAMRWLQPWRTLDQICRDAEDELKRPWLWTDILRPGAITLLVGPPKLGKSTLVFDFLSAMTASRGECIGRSLSKANVLYVSEEGEVPLAFKGLAPRLVALRHAKYVSFLTSFEAGGDWPGLMTLIEQAVAEMPHSPGFLPPDFPLCIVIDTLGFFMGLDDENQAGQVRTALKLLVDIVRKHNLAVLLLHHTRKQGAKDENWVASVQGNTAFAGNVDIVSALDGNYGNARRKLYVIGRFGAPEPIELMHDDETGYRVQTDEERELERQRWTQEILKVLAGNPALTVRTIASETGISKSSVGRIVKDLKEGAAQYGREFKEHIEILNGGY